MDDKVLNGVNTSVLDVAHEGVIPEFTLEPGHETVIEAKPQRLALVVEYLGSHYHGWQVQPNVDSVQARVQAALSRIANHPVEVVCAGRTDRGVHATMQVVHFDTLAQRNDQAWQRGVLSLLPRDIGLHGVWRMPDHFHARFSALRRSYRYVLYNGSHRPGLLHGRVSWHHLPLDVARMQQAAAHLLGLHDFSSFRGKECQAHSPLRTLYTLDIQREGDFIYFDLCANAFLMHMVRNIVGTLMLVGAGRREPAWVAAVLAERRREAAGMTAPPDGLYLTHVAYPETFSLSLPPRLPRF